MDRSTRIQMALMMQEVYPDFLSFAHAGMQFLGFDLTEMQADIAEFMENGPRLRMVQAQRGQAKTTLAALYGIWRIIHNLSFRVLIVSAGEDMAGDISTLMVRIIMQWDVLEYMRPDKTAGDRVSVIAFDVNHELKGVDKSPSISCRGILSGLSGARADLILADDVEDNKKGFSPSDQAKLREFSKEFSSINQHGHIMYLGTPHNRNSLYNTLPARGFTVRIWPGRYPTEEEEARYNGNLAPMIVKRMQENPSIRTGYGIDGTRGMITEPVIYTESLLIDKELDMGPETFQLQFMLDTTMSDEVRQQLKLSDFIVANFESEYVPEIIGWGSGNANLVPLGAQFPVPNTKMYYPAFIASTFGKPKEIVAYMDPAGGGQDELAVCCGFVVGPYIHVLDMLAVRGGLNPENDKAICDFMVRNKVTRLVIEDNMGHGAFRIALRSVFQKSDNCQYLANAITGETVSGQKEVRIIQRLVSAMQRHRIVIHPRVFEADTAYCSKYGADVRAARSVFFQIAFITTDRASLVHDDRIEALAGLVNQFSYVLDQDEKKAAEQRKKDEIKEFLDNPMGYTDAAWMNRNKRSKGTRGRIR